MANKITPLGTRVLVKRIELAEQKSEGGIFLPDTAKEKPQEAEVLALGNGKNDEGEIIEFSVKVGDNVLISKYGGTEVKVNGEECVIVNESDILENGAEGVRLEVDGSGPVINNNNIYDSYHGVLCFFCCCFIFLVGIFSIRTFSSHDSRTPGIGRRTRKRKRLYYRRGFE